MTTNELNMNRGAAEKDLDVGFINADRDDEPLNDFIDEDRDDRNYVDDEHANVDD